MSYDPDYDQKHELLKNGICIYSHHTFPCIDIPINDLIYSHYMYEEGHIGIIYKLNDKVMHDQILTISEYKKYIKDHPNHTLVIRGIEGLDKKTHDNISYLIDDYDYEKQFNFNSYFTAHLYIAKENSPSFLWHTDPDNVIIAVLEGEKRVYIRDNSEKDYYDVSQGNYLVIPANTEHRVENLEPSKMLSIGYGKWLMDKIKGN